MLIEALGTLVSVKNGLTADENKLLGMMTGKKLSDKKVRQAMGYGDNPSDQGKLLQVSASLRQKLGIPEGGSVKDFMKKTSHKA
jgi:hypothetical protein